MCTIAAPSADSKSLFGVLISEPFWGHFLKVDSIENELCVEGLDVVSGLAFSWTLIEGEWQKEKKTLTNNYFKKCFSRRRTNLKIFILVPNHCGIAYMRSRGGQFTDTGAIATCSRQTSMSHNFVKTRPID